MTMQARSPARRETVILAHLGGAACIGSKALPTQFRREGSFAMKESLKEDTFEAEKVTLAKADFNDLMEDTASSAFRPSVAVTERDSLAEPSVSTRRRRVRKGLARRSAAAPEVQSMLMNAVAALEEQGSIEDMTDAQLQAAIDGAIRTSDAPETLRRQRPEEARPTATPKRRPTEERAPPAGARALSASRISSWARSDGCARQHG